MVRCGLPLSLNALMMNMREPVHICKPLRETIGVEMTTTKLTNLYTLISNLLDKNMQIMIPFKHQPHLRSNTNSINSKNMNEILSKHCRFSNPRLRSAFVTENQMIIEDMQPRQEFHIEVPEIHLIDIFSCPTCTGQFSLEAYEKHVGLGPFAPGHNLFYSTDNELFFLVTMAAFSFSGENVPCEVKMSSVSDESDCPQSDDSGSPPGDQRGIVQFNQPSSENKSTKHEVEKLSVSINSACKMFPQLNQSILTRSDNRVMQLTRKQATRSSDRGNKRKQEDDAPIGLSRNKAYPSRPPPQI